MILAYKEILSNLKKKIFHPIYFLFGDEPYYIDNLVDFIEDKVLSEADKAFNQSVLYGKDVTVDQIKEAASRLPMMAAYQVVIIKEAQEVGKIEELESYVAKAVPSTILVFAYKHKKVDKRKTFFKKLLKDQNVIAMESEAIKDYNLQAWMQQYLSGRGLKVAPVAVSLLVEFLGNDLSKIEKEIDKLIFVKDGDPNVSVDDIEKNIGISKEYNVFELNNALGDRDTLKCARIVKYFEQNPKAVFIGMAIGSIYGFFEKVHLTKVGSNISDNELARVIKLPPFLASRYRNYARNYQLPHIESIFTTLEEYDLKSKGVGATGGTESMSLLKELTAKILAHN